MKKSLLIACIVISVVVMITGCNSAKEDRSIYIATAVVYARIGDFPKEEGKIKRTLILEQDDEPLEISVELESKARKKGNDYIVTLTQYWHQKDITPQAESDQKLSHYWRYVVGTAETSFLDEGGDVVPALLSPEQRTRN